MNELLIGALNYSAACVLILNGYRNANSNALKIIRATDEADILLAATYRSKLNAQHSGLVSAEALSRNHR